MPRRMTKFSSLFREKIKKVTDKLIDKFCTLTPVSYETAAKTVCFCLSRFLISTEDEIRTAKLLLTHPALKKCGLAEHLSKGF